MKSEIVAFIIILFIGLSSCSKEDENTPPSGVSRESVVSTVSAGSWKITNFTDSGKDETYHFSVYLFTFGVNDSISATNGTEVHYGIWSVEDSSSENNPEFHINFSSSAGFEDLNDDWDIIECSGSRIKLKDVSGGNGGTDYLTFDKI